MHGFGVGTVSAAVPFCVNGASLTSSWKKTHLMNYGFTFTNGNKWLWKKKHHSCSLLSTKERTNFVTIRAASSSSVGSEQYVEEPATGLKFATSLTLPGCPSTLTLLGTGYREKVFAIIGVKVYAAGFYLNSSIYSGLDAWKGKQSVEIQSDTSLFNSVFKASMEKSLKIVLVRDVDGKTFWDALDEAISPRIKAPTPVDESALSKFRSIFQGRPLEKGTSIFLTWLSPAKMLVSISADGLPTEADAAIESENVTNALYDVFLGASPVSPSLKASVAEGLASALK